MRFGGFLIDSLRRKKPHHLFSHPWHFIKGAVVFSGFSAVTAGLFNPPLLQAKGSHEPSRYQLVHFTWEAAVQTGMPLVSVRVYWVLTEIQLQDRGSFFGTHLSTIYHHLRNQNIQAFKGWSLLRQTTHLFSSHSPFPMFYSLRKPESPRRAYISPTG